MKEKIPKYFAVKRSDCPEWQEYIDWLNKTYVKFPETKWIGNHGAYYGYDGSDNSHSGTIWEMETKKFKNNPVVFEDVKEFMKLLKNQTMKKEEFSISGSIPLKKAFVEELGLKLYSYNSCEQEGNLTAFDINTLGSDKIQKPKHFNLPQDWEVAKEYVKNYWEEEFKVGDAIITKGACENEVRFITWCKIDGNDLRWKQEGDDIERSWSINSIIKATPVEIQKAKEKLESKITLAGYTSEYKSGYVRFGCTEWNKNEIEAILRFVKAMKIHKFEVTEKQLETILKKI